MDTHTLTATEAANLANVRALVNYDFHVTQEGPFAVAFLGPQLLSSLFDLSDGTVLADHLTPDQGTRLLRAVRLTAKMDAYDSSLASR